MILSSVGTILIAIAMNSTQAWAGALYYMVHSTLIGAAFISCGWITSQRGEFKDHFKIAPQMKQNTGFHCIFHHCLDDGRLATFQWLLR